MAAESQHFEAGEWILHQGDHAEYAYLIESGQVQVVRGNADDAVVLAELGPGEMVGEMGIISEKPRSASVRALTPTSMVRISREELLTTLQDDRTSAIALLKTLFERLRQADVRMTQLEPQQSVKTAPQAGEKRSPIAQLVALTAEAAQAMGHDTVRIEKLPFRIGRRDQDPLRCNELELEDRPPYRVSRHHLLLDLEQGRLVVYDRGSRVGSWVNGQPLGGKSQFSGPIYLGAHPMEVVLGPGDSALRFRLELVG